MQTRCPPVLWSVILAWTLAGAPLSALQEVQTPAPEAGAVGLPARGDNRDAVVESVLALGRSDNRVEEHLRYLTKAIGPRLTGSTSLTRAGEWARAQFQGMGLEARLERWGEFPVGFDRRAMSGRLLGEQPLELVFSTPCWTPGTPGLVRGHVVLEPRTLEELAAHQSALPGAWLLRQGRRPARELSTELEAAFDAAGILGEIKAAGELVLTYGNQNVSFDNLPKRVSVLLRKDQHKLLLERAQAGESLQLEFDIDNRFFPGPVPLYNVVADLVGSERPDEYVIVGGHLDSWDGAEGAQDNGTGVATTLEAARLLTACGAQPRRTIRFMLWSGEEQGLFGSRGYVDQHPDLMPKISLVLVHDGGTNYLSGLAGPKALVDDLRWASAPLADYDANFPFSVTENEGLSSFGASDHSSFTAVGVPGIFWEQAGETDYNFVHHTQHDTFENARQDYQRQSSVVVAVTAYNVAQLPKLLDRTKLMRPQGERDQTRRVMGVGLEECTINSISPGSMAEKAGWKEGDVILSIEGVAVSTRSEVTRELQAGGPLKKFVLQRGGERIESALDYSGQPSEIARAKLAEAKAKEAAGQAAAPPAADQGGAGSEVPKPPR